jgi:hypothetical protein
MDYADIAREYGCTVGAVSLHVSRQNEEYLARCARARESAAPIYINEIKDVTNEVHRGTLPPDAGRVVINALQWQAMRRAPRSLGDKVQTEHTGAGGGPIIERIERVIIDPSK